MLKRVFLPAYGASADLTAVRIRAAVWARNYPAGKRIYLHDLQLIKLQE